MYTLYHDFLKTETFDMKYILGQDLFFTVLKNIQISTVKNKKSPLLRMMLVFKTSESPQVSITQIIYIFFFLKSDSMVTYWFAL